MLEDRSNVWVKGQDGVLYNLAFARSLKFIAASSDYPLARIVMETAGEQHPDIYGDLKNRVVTLLELEDASRVEKVYSRLTDAVMNLDFSQPSVEKSA